jgi:hypothetical protein
LHRGELLLLGRHQRLACLGRLHRLLLQCVLSARRSKAIRNKELESTACTRRQISPRVRNTDLLRVQLGLGVLRLTVLLVAVVTIPLILDANHVVACRGTLSRTRHR